MPTTLACLLVVTLGYILLCVVAPFRTCRLCNGLGFALRTDRRGRPTRGRACRRCHGNGRHLRTGRRAYELAARIHHHATPHIRKGPR
ncbi:hypothetical protein PJ985_02635 [Streptomyces sp. ACA25]|uniref:hypothetical protein n=1 Tax=Streptomyces sp. ACA25 TaxID=3022596 RepID=UPI0023070B2D|nr:hypothetical protein [Streptomyces sp. ACA25]MDB1086466.1 hypothetical protein [Streptomyces sp. ACA25]